MAHTNASVNVPLSSTPFHTFSEQAAAAAAAGTTSSAQGPLPASLREYFVGKNILVTGVTGFVGKVFLEKLLREFPDIGKVYVLMRTKKGVEARERLSRDVLKSQCFDVLREQLGESRLQELFRTKVEPVEGDIEQEYLGLSDERTLDLVSSINMVAHIAATIDFNERFDIAIRQNVLGALRMLALSRRCVEARGSGFEAHVHISTCYVNWPRHSATVPVLEQVYPLPFDPQQLAGRVLDMYPSEVEEETPRLLKQFNYPNTYTITKAMSEYLLMENRGDVPFCIVRPAIVGCSIREPMPGWTDTLSAAGGMLLMTGLGLLKEMPGDEHALADIVPVDLVVNCTLRALHATAVRFRPYALTLPKGGVNGGFKKRAVEAVFSAATKSGLRALPSSRGPVPPTASVYHAGTSGSNNAATWQEIRNQIVFFWARHPHPKSLTKTPSVHFCRSEAEYAIRFYLMRQTPSRAFTVASKAPLASEKLKRDAEQLAKAVTQSRRRTKLFIPFTRKGWNFDHTLSNAQLMAQERHGRSDGGVHLTEEELRAFPLDYENISWRVYITNFCWGLMQFVTKEGPKSQMHDPADGGHAVLLRAML